MGFDGREGSSCPTPAVMILKWTAEPLSATGSWHLKITLMPLQSGAEGVSAQMKIKPGVEGKLLLFILQPGHPAVLGFVFNPLMN